MCIVRLLRIRIIICHTCRAVGSGMLFLSRVHFYQNGSAFIGNICITWCRSSAFKSDSVISAHCVSICGSKNPFKERQIRFYVSVNSASVGAVESSCWIGSVCFGSGCVGIPFSAIRFYVQSLCRRNISVYNRRRTIRIGISSEHCKRTAVIPNPAWRQCCTGSGSQCKICRNFTVRVFQIHIEFDVNYVIVNCISVYDFRHIKLPISVSAAVGNVLNLCTACRNPPRGSNVCRAHIECCRIRKSPLPFSNGCIRIKYRLGRSIIGESERKRWGV